jgi:hypothetical protein
MSQSEMPEWRNTDPRVDFIDMNRVEIVIIRPSINCNGWEAGIGYAEMEHGYSVWTSFENHKHVNENEKWDPAWFWVRAPEGAR